MSAFNHAPAPRISTSGKVIAALVLGIVGLSGVPLVASIIAVVYGVKARNEIDARPHELEGRGLATAGLVLGWVGIAITAAVALSVGIVLALVA